MRAPLRPSARFAVAVAVGALAAAGSGAGEPAGDLAVVVEETGRAAKGLLRDDRPLALAGLDAALPAAAALALPDDEGDAALGPRAAGFRRAAARMEARLSAARAAVADPEGRAWTAWGRLRRGLRDVVRAEARLRRTDAVPPLALAGRGGGVLPPRRRRTLSILAAGGECGDAPAVVTVEEGPGAASVPPVEDLGGGRLRFTGGDGPGTLRVTVTACGVERTWRWVNPGRRGAIPREGPWGGAGAPPADLSAPPTLLLRAGVAAVPLPPSWSGGEPEKWSVDPPLPAGLVLDRWTGRIGGTPSAASPTAIHLLTAANPHGAVSVPVSVQVTPALPPGLLSLEDGFEAEVLHGGLAVPVKMALAGDGRLFFNELAAGNVRVVGGDGVLRGTPVATLPVLPGGERGLLGLALAPDFDTAPALFVYVSSPASDGHPDRNRVLRLPLVGDGAVGVEVVVDDLPVGATGNAGDLQFGPDGRLYVSVGDTGDGALAQADGQRAGRILRYGPDGSVPADNPLAGDPEWCRGLRNAFDMTFHPVAGGLFVTENGPTAHDELDFIQPGRNFGWEVLPDEFPGSLLGLRLRDWTPVIVPTGLAFHSGAGFGAAYADSLFVAGYDDADLRRLAMSGPAFVDIDEERTFARWDAGAGIAHRPLDLVVTPAGDLLVSTFTAIWRIRRYP